MSDHEIIDLFSKHPAINELADSLSKYHQLKISLDGLKGSALSIIVSIINKRLPVDQLVLLTDKEAATYFINDLQSFVDEKKILFYPSPYKKDNILIRYNPASLERINTLNAIKHHTSGGRIIVSYPLALAELVVKEEDLEHNSYTIKVNTIVDLDFLIDFLHEYGFEQTDFVGEAGQFSLRGNILDVFSYANHLPYRIELIDNKIETIREFEPDSQLSVKKMDHITIMPNLDEGKTLSHSMPFFEFISPKTIIHLHNPGQIRDIVVKHIADINEVHQLHPESHPGNPKDSLINPDKLPELLLSFSCIELGAPPLFKPDISLTFDQSPQPNFNKNFDILGNTLIENENKGITNYIFSDSSRQVERIYTIFEDLKVPVKFIPIYKTLYHGFTDNELKLACFTEHEIFNRFQKAKTKQTFSKETSLSLKELYQLKPGDYVTHINHGVGIFSGLQKLKVAGRSQEAIRIEYKDGDMLYVSIHSFHKIARYVGKEGTTPKIYRLGSNAWETLKQRTKNRVKDIARDLIKLYAKRRASKGFQFAPDTYLQTELEASFIYEDTPDQTKSTEDVKLDMERPYPMDRLICGDVGYGKTEVAIRAAVKAVADGKQVAVLVPTTILAFQHNKTFTDRLRDFPADVDYLSRFKSPKKEKEILRKLEEGKIDIIIGTHKLLSNNIKFKDLGLLIIDEEQKFGVAAKERLRTIKTNVDTLSLTATPIPRTLQFSLMGVRDLSIINTAPPNRQAIETHIAVYSENIILEALEKELDRNGQIFFVHNRIKDIEQMAALVKRLIPGARIAVGHGRMENADLEEVMTNFIDGYYDVLVSTNIIESGLDIPNVNTIIINDAQNFGLSDLYQMRGRVGRSNIKAYCHLLIPSYATITSDARKRLSAIEEFSELGSGFHIAMRDMDIRGAGNMLGAEQSGFITDIGLDMYKKILDEAIQELKTEEFGELFKDDVKKAFYKESQVDTDLEVLIPDDYVTNIEERLILYNKLNRTENEKELKSFETELVDRFGPLPPETSALMNLIRVKWIASRFGIEKLILKNGRIKAIFPFSNAQNTNFQKNVFEKILRYAKNNPDSCKFQEEARGLNLSIAPAEDIDDTLAIFKSIDQS